MRLNATRPRAEAGAEYADELPAPQGRAGYISRKFSYDDPPRTTAGELSAP
jgi:hypothetical protein